jgi:Leucine-rich repeat (LRR) protein
MDKWADVSQALEDMKRELKVHVETPELAPELADRLWACTHLRVLTITGGALKSLPAGIAQLSELTTLIVSGNSLVSLPREVAALPNLRVLEAEDNSLDSLPHDDEAGWGALEVLNVARNNLSSLAPIAGAARLLSLKADSNMLSGSFPLSGWPKIKTLILSHNMLSTLEGVGQLTLLETLDIGHNRFSQLPAELCLLKERVFKHLVFDGNPEVTGRVKHRMKKCRNGY